MYIYHICMYVCMIVYIHTHTCMYAYVYVHMHPESVYASYVPTFPCTKYLGYKFTQNRSNATVIMRILGSKQTNKQTNKQTTNKQQQQQQQQQQQR